MSPPMQRTRSQRMARFVGAYHAVRSAGARRGGAALPDLIATRHAMTLAITGWRAKRYPENRSYILRNQASAIDRARRRWRRPAGGGARSLPRRLRLRMRRPPMTGMVNAFDPQRARRARAAGRRRSIDRRERLLGPAYRLFYEHPVHLVRGEGVWLFDRRAGLSRRLQQRPGRRSLPSARRRGAVAPGGDAQHPYALSARERAGPTPRRCRRPFPAALSQVMFTCTGSEANDLALRVAKSAPAAPASSSPQHAYHGVTDAVAGLSPSLGPSVAPAPHVVTVAGARRRRRGRAVRRGRRAALDAAGGQAASSRRR